MRRFTRWYHAAACLGLLALLGVACSVLLDHDAKQCSVDSDCATFPGHPYCQSNVCVTSNLGPEGCFFGTPKTPQDFANQCSTAQCQPFDNCARLGLCSAGAVPPDAIDPPPIDAGTPPIDSSIDAAPPPVMPPCVDPATRNTVVVSGSTAVQPFMAVVAPLLAQNSPPFQIAYQPAGSCGGVDGLFSPDPNKHVIKDIPGKQALLFNTDGTSVACTFGAGTTLDVAVSDVFASSCTSTYATSSTLAEYLGPVQPMTFVVPSTSTQMSISSEMGHVVFGLGSTDDHSMPFTDPTLYFVRNSGSGTQQMISRAIGVDAKKWWGVDRGGSGNVKSLLEAVAPANAEQAIGILSTDFADPERSRLRILAYQGANQLCGYYPDSTLFNHDKANIRDGHYPIWGPVHFYAAVTNGVPSAAAGALVTRFTLPRLDQPLLDAIIKIGFVPTCAMTVQHTGEMGPITSFSPEFQCGCYFDATVTGGTPRPDCTTCAGPADCPSSKPACNNGYCEVQ
jgi:ABC-type phosphate transport system substrate-binding protein